MDKLHVVSTDNRLFTYKVAADAGNAPNPYHSVCTLGICKPAIRRVAKPGDVILGLDCGKDESRIIYCMVVGTVIPWADYIAGCQSGHFQQFSMPISKKLKEKIPKDLHDHGDCIWKNASNIHDPLDSRSGHKKCDFHRDVENGANVLVSETYWYFGGGDLYNVHLPDHLKKIIPGRGHRSSANDEYIAKFVKFFNEELIRHEIKTTGKFGTPKLDPGNSDEETRSRCRTEERESDLYGDEG